MDDSSYEKLERFKADILAAAKADAREVYAAIQQESDQALSSAEDEGLGETFRYIKNETARIRSAASQRVSKAVMDNKRALARRRSEMSEETLDLVRGRLAEYVQTDAYKSQLRQLTERAVEAFQADTEIYLRPEDMSLSGSLASGGVYKVTFHEDDIRVGGLRAVCPGKHMRIDESFDAVLADMSGRFAELFGLKMAEQEPGLAGDEGGSV